MWHNIFQFFNFRNMGICFQQKKIVTEYLFRIFGEIWHKKKPLWVCVFVRASFSLRDFGPPR
jgi:hypothetical protein